MSSPNPIAWPVRNCTICLEEVERPGTIDPCGHTFCYDCINEWLVRRNQCPLCRRPSHGMVNIPYMRRRAHAHGAIHGFILSGEYTTYVSTPEHSPLYLVAPVKSPNSPRIYYSFRRLEADNTYFFPAVEPGTLWVLPDNLLSITSALESRGITGIEADLQSHLESNCRHGSFLAKHRPHQRVGAEEATPYSALTYATTPVLGTSYREQVD